MLQAQAECLGEFGQLGPGAFPPAVIKDDHRQFAVADSRVDLARPSDVLAGIDDLPQLTRQVRQRDQVAGRESCHRKSPLVERMIHPMTVRATPSVVEPYSHTR